MSLDHYIELGIAYLLAVMMPGPSITLIVKNALVNSRLSSIQASLGTIVGTALQSGTVLCILVFIEKNLVLFKTLKVLCSVYLIYLGLKILFAGQKQKISLTKHNLKSSWLSIKQNYFLEALLIEFLNPLAFTFFISIISAAIDHLDGSIEKFICWLEIVSIGFLWFFTVSLVVSSQKVTFYTRNFNKILENLSGCIFILFGSKMLIF
jgi:threonine efflux protein